MALGKITYSNIIAATAGVMVGSVVSLAGTAGLASFSKGEFKEDLGSCLDSNLKKEQDHFYRNGGMCFAAWHTARKIDNMHITLRKSLSCDNEVADTIRGLRVQCARVEKMGQDRELTLQFNNPTNYKSLMFFSRQAMDDMDLLISSNTCK